jgi:mediator of RNA polymerase II transcription subunit 31
MPESEHDEPLPTNRFELELEFVQSLASPAYLHFLATQGYLEDKKFLQFLRYLKKYWETPEYARFITFPHCLFFLDLLCRETDGDTFRRELSNVSFRNYVHEQQFYNWQYRSRHLYGEGLLSRNTAVSNNAPVEGSSSNTKTTAI